MNDKTIIRPGGRRPRRGGGGSDGGDDDDRTQVAGKSAPAPEPEPEREEPEDRTMIRPSRGRSRRRSQKPEQAAPAPREEEKAPDLSAVDDIFGSLSDAPQEEAAPAAPERPARRGAGARRGRRAEPEPEAPAPAPREESEADADGDKTQFRAPKRRRAEPAEPEAPAEEAADGEDKTQFRRRPSRRAAEAKTEEIESSKRPAGRPMPERRSRERESAKLPETETSPTVVSSQFLRQASAVTGDDGVAGLVSPLLVMVGRLQSVAEHPNVEDFKEFAIDSIRYYQSVSFGFGDASGSKLSGLCSYGICALIDEVVLNTPWGVDSTFRDDGLLQIFHGDQNGNERFFEIIDELRMDAKTNLPALELLFLLLELGFEGKYADSREGNRELVDLREDLYVVINATRGVADGSLSENWEGLPGKKNPLLEYVPFWVVMSVTVALMVFAFAGFNIMLSRSSDGVLRELAIMGNKEIEIASVAIPAAPLSGDGPVTAEPDLVRNNVDVEALEMLLFLEIDEGVVELVEKEELWLLRLKHTDLFNSGSHQLNELHAGLVETIGGFLKGSNGKIMVTGHTDDIPVRSLKYPSNWELSKQRAETVRGLIADASGLGTRVKAQGLADTDNIVPNDNDRNRAINRRVEIQIRK